MEFLTAIKQQIPDYAKDIRLNLDGAIARSSLAPDAKMGYSTGLALQAGLNYAINKNDVVNL